MDKLITAVTLSLILSILAASLKIPSSVVKVNRSPAIVEVK